MTSDEYHSGNLINGLVDLVDHCLDGRAQSRDLLTSVMRVAYAEGVLQGTTNAVKRLEVAARGVPGPTFDRTADEIVAGVENNQPI